MMINGTDGIGSLPPEFISTGMNGLSGLIGKINDFFLF
jgi:hypothetical protein